MRLTVIGCSGSFPGPGSPASCYLVEHDGFRLVLDMGNGSLGPLSTRVHPRELDAVVLSHLHPDHCLDLTSLYVARRYHPEGLPARKVAVHAPRGAAARLAAAYNAGDDEGDPGLSRVYEFHDHVPDAPVKVGPFSITVTRVRHPVEAFAVRVEAGGRALVYSGDTGPCEELIELAQGADLGLFEASFLRGGANPPNLHLTAQEAGAAATAAGVGRLVLTHLVAWNDLSATLAEAREEFAGDVRLAEAGMVVDL